LQLAAALDRRQDLGQRAARPATARQLPIEQWKTGRQRRHGTLCRAAAAPYALPPEEVFEGRRKNGHAIGHKSEYCIYIQYCMT